MNGKGGRLFGPLGAILALLLLFNACASSTDRAESGELVWVIGEIEAGQDGPAKAVADLWNEFHEPKVRVEALPRSADEQRQILAIELNAGLTNFDIATLDVIWTGEFAESGWLVDLESMRRPIEEESLPGPFQSATWRGRLWAAPFTTGAGFLYYRKDLVPTPPRTWKELQAVGIKAGDKAGIAPFVGQGAQYEGMVVNFLEYFWAAGGELFSPDGTEVRFKEGPARRAIDFMRNAVQKGFYPPGFRSMTEEEARNAFQSGNAVFMRNWPYAYPLVTARDSKVADRVGIAPLPTFDDGKETISALGGQNLAVSPFSKNVKAAKEFVKFASTSPEVQRMIGAEHSRAPTMSSVYEALAEDPVMALLEKVLPYAKPRPPAPAWAAISDEIQQQVYPAYIGERDPDTAISAIRSFLERSIEEQ